MRIWCSKIRQSRRWLSVVVLLLVGLVFTGCTGAPTIPRGWSGGTVEGNNLYVGTMGGRLVAVNTDNGSLLWAAKLEMGVTSGGGLGCAQGPTTVAIYGAPAVSDNLVYVGGYNGKVYAYPSAGREEPKWLYPRQGNLAGPIVGSLVTAQGRVYFASASGTVYALDAAEGYKVWDFRTKEKIWSTPVIAGDTVFIGTFGKKLYALNIADGTKKWEFKAEGAIVATPVVDGNTVYIGSFDRKLYALDTATGSLKWKFPAVEEDENKPGKWFWAKPVVYNGVIYAASLDGKLYVLKTDNGQKVAEFDLNSPISSSLILVGNSVVVATEGGIIYTVDTANNEKKKLASLGEKVFASLSAGQGSVFVHTASDALYAVDAASGKKHEFTIK
ncbi:MAG: PQQ-binding-like beta-propeller repeat protein [Dehalococcoidales bacterium]|nr:PQQ-binding-like beta-propeller repeat protein [Dehalococcoidales bacterium]